MRKPKGNEGTEWWIKKEVKKILEATEWDSWMPAANVFGRNGISDFLCVKKPRLFVAIETKYRDVVTAQQFEFLTTVHAAGHYALLVDETNIDRLHKLLTNIEDDNVDIVPMIEPFLKWRNQSPIIDVKIAKI